MEKVSVLVVEDHHRSRKLYTYYLEHAGYHVVGVASAKEAFEHIAACCPHAIVLDISLPHINGLALARQLKQDPRTAWVPLLMVTVHRQQWCQEDAQAVGADGFLMMPEGLPRLAAEVARLLTLFKGLTSFPKKRESAIWWQKSLELDRAEQIKPEMDL